MFTDKRIARNFARRERKRILSAAVTCRHDIERSSCFIRCTMCGVLNLTVALGRSTYVYTGLLFRSTDKRSASSTAEQMQVDVDWNGSSTSGTTVAKATSVLRSCLRASPGLYRRDRYYCCWRSEKKKNRA